MHDVADVEAVLHSAFVDDQQSTVVFHIERATGGGVSAVTSRAMDSGTPDPVRPPSPGTSGLGTTYQHGTGNYGFGSSPLPRQPLPTHGSGLLDDSEQ